MKRNAYAIALLVLLALLLGGSGLYVHATAEELRQDINNAYALALRADYAGAQRAYRATVAVAEARGGALRLFVRRALVDKLQETIATLPHYAHPDNRADLAVETARANAQIEEMATSFWDWA